MIVYCDIETYCSVNLKKSNVYAYTESPDFEVLMCAWSIDGDAIHVDEGEPTIRERFQEFWDSGATFVAHNAGFERIAFSRLIGMKTGEYLPPERWIDTAALAAENGFPRSLDMLAKALGAEEKDTAGTRLINLFCAPYRGKRVFPEDRPDKWAEFLDYCAQDVASLIDVHRLLPGWPVPSEEVLWYVDQRVNDAGIKVDLPFIRKAVQAAQENQEAAEAEVTEITGVANPNSVQQLAFWLAKNDLALSDMQAATVTTALAKKTLKPEVRRVLELRQELALVASNKYAAALRGVSEDGRLRGQFVFHGAHTGRWSSRGVQVHNLPRQSDPNEAAAILDLLYDFGASPNMLKSLVRPMFLGPFCISDFSAIEARVLAWMAGEQWVLDAFAGGRDIYVETAQRMGGLTRQQGKVAVLALGYQGAVGSLRVMGAEGTDEALVVLVEKWRRANPRIVRFWKRLETAFRHGGDIGLIKVEAEGSIRKIRLPSGRALTYHGVTTGQRLTYRHIRGYREDTYGGRLTENVTQAVARDLLADAMIRLDSEGYRVVAHVHDEVVVESDDAKGIKEIMRAGTPWSAGLPLDASADLTERYTK